MKKLKLKPVTQEQQGQVAGGSIHDKGQPACGWWIKDKDAKDAFCAPGPQEP